MVIMPAAPVIFSLPFFIEGKIMENTTNVPISCINNPKQMIFWISLHVFMSIGINLFSKHLSYFNHELWKSFNIFLYLWNLIYPFVSNIHLNFFLSVKFFILISDWLRIIRWAVNIVTSFGSIISPLKLLNPTWPSQAVIYLWAHIFLKCLFRKTS